MHSKNIWCQDVEVDHYCTLFDFIFCIIPIKKLNTVVFVTFNPNIHNDSIFLGRVVSPIKSYNHNMALAVLLMKEDTNCLVNKVRNFNL